MLKLLCWQRWCLAALASLAGASLGLAQAPTPAPSSSSSEPEIEVYIGTTKVAPIPPPPAPVIIIQEAPKPEPKPEPKEDPKPRVEAPVFVPIIPAGAWSPLMGPNPLPGSIAEKSEKVTPQGNTIFHLMSHLMTRFVMASLPKSNGTQAVSTSAPQIIILRDPAASVAPVSPAPQAPPQVVIVKEQVPAPAPTPVPEVPQGLSISWEMLGMISFAAIGVLCVVFLLGRSNKAAMSVQPALVMGPPADYDPAKHGPLLSGKYVAGPLPETAERFDIGPSYHDELKAKERAEEAAKQAVVANILVQNLDLFDVEEKPAE